MIKIHCKSVLGGWQTQTESGYLFGPVFNKTTDLWDWQRDHLQRPEGPITPLEAVAGALQAIVDAARPHRVELGDDIDHPFPLRFDPLIEQARAALALV